MSNADVAESTVRPMKQIRRLADFLVSLHADDQKLILTRMARQALERRSGQIVLYDEGGRAIACIHPLGELAPGGLGSFKRVIA